MLWHNFLPHVPRLTRYTMGVKIDNLFIELLEITFTAKYAKREDKLTFLKELSKKLDNLKFFITLLWEAKGLEAGQYGQLSQKLTTAGKMSGKWLQLFKTELPPSKTGVL
ncbi:MAG: four helix bundle protein [Patescibacteria group bacterium]